jgi:hypothetical protein
MALGDNDAQVFLLILVFLAAWTGIVGVINMASSGEITMDTLGSMTGTIPGQVNFDVSNPYESQTINPQYDQDYTNSTGYSDNITVLLGGTALGPMWTQADGVGYTCMNIPFWPLFQPAELGLLDVLPTDNVYDVQYSLTPNGVPNFYTMVYSVGTTNGLFIKYDTTGLSLVTLGPLGMSSPINYLPSAGANTASQIETKYNTAANTITVLIGGSEVGTFSNVPLPSVGLDYPGISYGGVATYHTGISVQKMHGLFSSVSDLAQNNDNPLSAIGSAFSQFMKIIAAAMGLSNQAIIPAGVWAVLGIPCIATLIYLGLKLLRG